MFISRKKLEAIHEIIINYALDVGQRAIKTKDQKMHAILNTKQRNIMDVANYLYNKCYKNK